MKRTSLLLLAVALSACANNDESVIVLGTEFLTPGMCTVAATPMASRTSGVLDVALVQLGYDGYHVYPAIKNNLVERAGGMVPERDAIQINAIDVKIQGPVAVSPSSFTTAVSGGSIAPQASAGVDFIGIPRSAALQLAAGLTGMPDPPTAIIEFRAVGRRADGIVTSGWVDFPVRLCAGCLAPMLNQDCPTMPALKTTQVVLGGCNISQDDPVTCCKVNGAAVCGSQVPTSM